VILKQLDKQKEKEETFKNINEIPKIFFKTFKRKKFQKPREMIPKSTISLQKRVQKP
jgi:hypothetical protein